MAKQRRTLQFSKVMVIKTSPLGIWSTREAGWVLFNEDSHRARNRVKNLYDSGKLMSPAVKSRQWDRTLFTTAALEQYLYEYRLKRLHRIKIDEQSWISGKMITHCEYAPLEDDVPVQTD